MPDQNDPSDAKENTNNTSESSLTNSRDVSQPSSRSSTGRTMVTVPVSIKSWIGDISNSPYWMLPLGFLVLGSLIASCVFWHTNYTFSLIFLVSSITVLIITNVLIGKSTKLFSFVGFAHLCTIVAGIITYVLLQHFSEFETQHDDSTIQYVIFPAFLWIVSSLIYELTLRENDHLAGQAFRESRESMWKWIEDHYVLATSIGLGYLIVLGLLFELSLFYHLGLSLLSYMHPNDLVFSVLKDPVFSIVMFISSILILLLLRTSWVWLRNLLERKSTFSVIVSRDKYTLIPKWGLWFLNLPNLSKNMFSFLFGLVVSVVVILMLFLFAIDRGAREYQYIIKQPTGRLTLSNSGVYADGLIHVTSTRNFMLFLKKSCEAEIDLVGSVHRHSLYRASAWRCR